MIRVWAYDDGPRGPGMEGGMSANDNTAFDKYARAEDKLNLVDVMAVADAVGRAEEALAKAMAGGGQDERDRFVYAVSFALGRLMRVRSRIRGEEPEPDAP